MNTILPAVHPAWRLLNVVNSGRGLQLFLKIPDNEIRGHEVPYFGFVCMAGLCPPAQVPPVHAAELHDSMGPGPAANHDKF